MQNAQGLFQHFALECMCVRVCVRACVHVRACVCVCECVHVCAHTCTCICARCVCARDGGAFIFFWLRIWNKESGNHKNGEWNEDWNYGTWSFGIGHILVDSLHMP